jgi:ubiquinone/menaquinone biosynthesis C-methylase UbiE
MVKLLTQRETMKLQSFLWLLTTCILVPTSSDFVAQSSIQSSEYSALLKRIEVTEKRNNERQPPDKVMDAIGVTAGMVIGEVGVGRGRYTVHLARRVGDTGKVYANDIDLEALDILRYRCERDEIANVEIILGDVEDPNFPDTRLDMIFMVWVYHMVEAPVPLLRSFGTSLKPGAKVVMVEPIPEEIEQELQEVTARGATDVHVNVLTKESMEAYAHQAGFHLIRTMEDLLERDVIYILVKE